MISTSESACKEFKEIENFDSLKASTKTIIAITNLTFNLNELYSFLPVVDYKPIIKRRGRKKKNAEVQIPSVVQPGSIIYKRFGNSEEGTPFKPKKKKDKKINYFLNSISIDMKLTDKFINFKISRNGKFQIVGCRSWEHARESIQNIWTLIQKYQNIHSFTYDDKLKIVFIPAMRNIVFSTGFVVDREKLNKLMNIETPFTSILETSFSYTGVNIKIPISKPLTTIENLHYLVIDNENSWNDKKHISYNDYISSLPSKDKIKETNKKRFITFLVFHSGKIIMSALHKIFMKDVYYDCLSFIFKNKKNIEEKLRV